MATPPNLHGFISKRPWIGENGVQHMLPNPLQSLLAELSFAVLDVFLSGHSVCSDPSREAAHRKRCHGEVQYRMGDSEMAFTSRSDAFCCLSMEMNDDSWRFEMINDDYRRSMGIHVL